MAAEIEAILGAEIGTYRAIFDHWRTARPDAPALLDDAGSLNWGEMMDRVDRIAAQLRTDGLEQGQSVAILGTSGIPYALVFLGAVMAGGVAAPLTTSATPEQLAGMVADSGAAHLFVDRAKLAELGEDFAPDLRVVVLDEELGDWMAPAGTPAPAVEPSADDPFNIIYSSGTTGIPKGIVHSHAMRWRQFAPTAAAWLKGARGNAGSSEPEPIRALASTPLYSNTTMVVFLAALLAGGSVRIMGKFDAARWLAHAETDRTNTTMLVPVQYRRLLDDPAFDRTNLSALRYKYCTSAPFAPTLKREVLDRMPGALIEIYSMTEGGVVCLLYAHEHPDKLHTVGRPAPGHRLRVLDDDDREVAPGEAGNLVGRSHTMMSGYRNRAEATDAARWIDPETGEAWMRMGDIGRVDADGFVELVGRAKDMIISGGFNIYPADLEAELERESGVVEAAVVGIASERWGETPVGFVVVADGAPPVDTILSAVNARLGKTQRLSALHTIAAMPRSHIGKLLKTELRDLAQQCGAS
ncbi:Surfactin synthase subunit [Alteripontixanthobacter maritimus]|uniref:Surfactin synthase subunit n=1 Tax=Alteripontixanthobacter maritimus TaxID=2161824 RepID=A0A369Q264_9SPHN|nr:class I adenylate-forming enzyme family protein [Alteripontixanthobacter maritimus]RDC59001.1 Surfactin synthase subunit [Alteripontixanthobacter maritimus]